MKRELKRKQKPGKANKVLDAAQTQTLPLALKPCPPSGPSYLADDEELLPPHSLLFDLLLDGFSHLILILIHIGTVNVAIPRINGRPHSFPDFPWGRLKGNRKDN